MELELAMVATLKDEREWEEGELERWVKKWSRA